MDLKPTAGKIIVKVDPEAEKTSGGLFLPGTSIGKGNLATVVARSPLAWEDKQGRLHSPLVHEGDRVIIGQYAGVQINYQGEEYVVLNHDEILAIIEQVPVG